MTIYVLTAKKFCTLIPVQKDIVTTIIMEANMRGLKTVLSFQNN